VTPILDLNPSKFSNCTPDIQATLLEWWDGPKHGLWVWAPRGEGSSYVGKVALRRALREIRESEHEEHWDYHMALGLMDLVRDSWINRYPDGDLPEELTSAERLSYAFDLSKVLMIDDFNDDAVDPKLWRKHIQPRVEMSVKSGRQVIIATNLAPEDRALEGLTSVIRSLFVVCDAGR
jgi:hypothetical protein